MLSASPSAGSMLTTWPELERRTSVYFRYLWVDFSGLGVKSPSCGSRLRSCSVVAPFGAPYIVLELTIKRWALAMVEWLVKWIVSQISEFESQSEQRFFMISVHSGPLANSTVKWMHRPYSVGGRRLTVRPRIAYVEAKTMAVSSTS